MSKDHQELSDSINRINSNIAMHADVHGVNDSTTGQILTKFVIQELTNSGYLLDEDLIKLIILQTINYLVSAEKLSEYFGVSLSKFVQETKLSDL